MDEVWPSEGDGGAGEELEGAEYGEQRRRTASAVVLAASLWEVAPLAGKFYGAAYRVYSAARTLAGV